MTALSETQSPLFAPLVGRLAWHVRRGIGTFLTMESGEPHLVVREPIEPRITRSARSVRRLKRRVVHLAGDWHFWIQHADWRLKTSNGELCSSDPIGTTKEEMLEDLDGQYLLSAASTAAGTHWTLTFDLGGTLEIWPADYEAEELWGLYRWDRKIVICRQDGTIEETEPAQEGTPSVTGGKKP